MGVTVTPLELKTFIIDALALEDIRPEDIGDDDPLFNGGLGLDSIDGLELDIALRKKFRIQTGEDGAAMSEHFRSIRTLAAYLAQCEMAPADTTPETRS
jgi:acyl carrier protein